MTSGVPAQRLLRSVGTPETEKESPLEPGDTPGSVFLTVYQTRSPRLGKPLFCVHGRRMGFNFLSCCVLPGERGHPAAHSLVITANTSACLTFMPGLPSTLEADLRGDGSQGLWGFNWPKILERARALKPKETGLKPCSVST